MAWAETYQLAGEPERYFLENPALVAENEAIVPWDAWREAAIAVHRLADPDDWAPDGTEHWDHTLPGDCENFALWKRKKLHEEDGLPLGAMRVCVGTDSTRGLHAVLLILTDRGEMVLDNLSPMWAYELGSEPRFQPIWRTGIGLTKEMWNAA